MARAARMSLVLLAVVICPISRLAGAQLKPLDSKSAKTEYSFSVRTGRPPLVIRVQIGDGGKIGDAVVFHQGEQMPFQTISSCHPELAMELYEGDEDRALVEHADFNFDGLEDLKLLQFYHPHLGKSNFCVYLWNEETGRFRYEPQIPGPDPIPHAENKTITTHNEYAGGTHSDSVYLWMAGKVVEIASWGLANEGRGLPGRENCPWTAFCYQWKDGKMRTVAFKPTGCDDDPPEEVTCGLPRLPQFNVPARRPK